MRNCKECNFERNDHCTNPDSYYFEDIVTEYSICVDFKDKEEKEKTENDN